MNTSNRWTPVENDSSTSAQKGGWGMCLRLMAHSYHKPGRTSEHSNLRSCHTAVTVTDKLALAFFEVVIVVATRFLTLYFLCFEKKSISKIDFCSRVKLSKLRVYWSIEG